MDQEREKFIYQSARDLIEELDERSVESPTAELADSSDSQLSILCVPARDEADEFVGLMLTQILRQSGHQAQAIGIGSVEDILARITKQKNRSALRVGATTVCYQSGAFFLPESSSKVFLPQDYPRLLGLCGGCGEDPATPGIRML